MKRSVKLEVAGRLASGFIENQGQWSGPAEFATRRGDVAAALEPHLIRLRLGRSDPQTVALVFEGASPRVILTGEKKQAGVYNFVGGRDAAAWRTNVPAYGSVIYRGLYDGVDVRVREQASHFEYDLIVAPHADLRSVVVRVEGATSLELEADGALILHTAAGPLRQTPPFTSETLPDGTTRPIASRFRIIGPQRYGFEAPDRDIQLPLVIDPGLVWSTLVGGTGYEELDGFEAARDGSGDLFVSGNTTSADFATTPSPVQAARYKTFVARLDASGAHYDFVTFISGLQGQTYPAGLAADAAGGVTIVGTTVDLDFPVTAGAYQTAFASPSTGQSNGDGFVMRLNATGNVAFATYLGGSGHDDVKAAVFDARLNTLIVTGFTQSSNFPTTVGAYDGSFNPPPPSDTTAFASDAFVSRLSLDGSQLEYSTYFGGQTYEHPTDVIVDPQGFVTVVGVTTSSASGARIPLTADAFDSTWNGSEDGFLARFKLDGLGSADLKYSTFLGGVNLDAIEGIAFDPNNPEIVIVAGHSWYDMFTGPFFPTTAGAFKSVLTPKPPASQLFPHRKTGFVTKFRFPAGAAGSLVWSTFAGGNWEDFLSDIAIDETGAVIVAGGTRSPDLQTTAGAFDRTQDGIATGPHDCFVWKLGPDGNRLDYSTYIGGLYEECAAALTIGARLAYLGNNTIALAGMSASGDFETTPGAVLLTTDEVTDGNNPFVAKLTLAAETADSAVNAPAPISPVNNSTTGGFGGVVRFRWTDVDDPSGIEGYVYEISPKPDFPEGFVHYRGSVNSAELLLESIAINTPYFWRVRAADGAGNLSDWSPTSTFTAGVTGAASIVNFVQTYPSTVTGGSPIQGVLHLSDPAPAGGATAILSTKDPRGHLRTDSPITLPATVTIPAGQITANFTIPTEPVTTPTPAAIYATVGALGSKGSLTVGTAPAVTAASLMLDPFAVTGGNPATGTVTLTGAAPSGGTVVPLLSSHPQYAAVPASVTVPAGATSATFPITTSAVPFSFDATIVATGGQFASRTLALKTPGPRLTAFNLSASTVSGGSTLTGTVTFSGPIPTSPFPAIGDALVTLKSTHPAVGFLPTVSVPVGQTSATFSIGVRNVPVTTTLNIIAAYDNTVLSRPVTVTGTSAALASLTLNVNTLTSGQGGAGFVNLTAPAPPGGVLVNLASHPAITVPSTVYVSQGTTSGIFSYGSLPVQATTSATITASYGPSSASAGVTVHPAASTNFWVTSLALSPSTVAAGTSSTATVTINAPAPAGGSTVQMSSVSPVVVPASVAIPAGATIVTFNVGTTSASSTTQVKVYAVLNTTWGAVLTVTAGSGSTPALSSLSLSPTSVTGGNSSQGTVTLSSAAPSGGAVVTLSSSNTAAATVPSSVTVAAGATSRTFTVTTQTVSSSTSATISGTLGVSRSATLTVNASTTLAAPSLIAPANAATVALPVTFDWSDVANAASYQIHVDDSSSFPSPRVIDVTVTASQYTHTSPALAIRQYWWRVRGRNAAGTAGSWSSVRSFTPEGTPAAPALSALSMNPTIVTGGTAVQGTATLTAPAPSGGAVVTLSSGNTAAVTVPASVTVPSGSTSATFAVTSQTVTASTTVTITGAFGGNTRTATVTVNPVAPTGTAMLTVSATGRSGERISSNPAGISVLVGSTGSASFTAGTSITLSVSNGRDAVWSGACSSGGDKTRTCTFTLNASATVSANVQ